MNAPPSAPEPPPPEGPDPEDIAAADRHLSESRMNRVLEHVAFWQFLCFVMLVALIWAVKVSDLPSRLFGEGLGKLSWVDACVFTGGVIIVGFITIGNTYLQQKRILRGFITVCSYCHKVNIEEEEWEILEAYVSRNSLAEFTHGVCPECYRKAMEDIERIQDSGGAIPAAERSD